MNIKRIYCGMGHEFTHENTGINNRGYRYCKECTRDRATVNNKKVCEARKIIRMEISATNKRIKNLLEKHKIIRSYVWRYSELKRLKQSIESCYRAEIRAAQQSGIKAPRLITIRQKVDGYLLDIL